MESLFFGNKVILLLCNRKLKRLHILAMLIHIQTIKLLIRCTPLNSYTE